MARETLLRHANRWHCRPITEEAKIRYASALLSDGERLELRDEPGRALSETEAADAIRAGKIVEVVS